MAPYPSPIPGAWPGSCEDLLMLQDKDIDTQEKFIPDRHLDDHTDLQNDALSRFRESMTQSHESRLGTQTVVSDSIPRSVKNYTPKDCEETHEGAFASSVFRDDKMSTPLANEDKTSSISSSFNGVYELSSSPPPSVDKNPAQNHDYAPISSPLGIIGLGRGDASIQSQVHHSSMNPELDGHNNNIDLRQLSIEPSTPRTRGLEARLAAIKARREGDEQKDPAFKVEKNTQVEHSRASHEANPRPLAKDQLVIAVMGATGTGKSTFINRLAPEKVEIGHSLTSCTAEIRDYSCYIDGKIVILVDTPGFNDTHKSDVDILHALAEWMKDAAEEGVFFSGIIYLYSLTDARMTSAGITNLRMFSKLCGQDHLNKVVLATTKAEITPDADVELRTYDLKKPGGFWAPYIAAGSKVCNLENSFASAKALVKEVLSLNETSFIPRIQQEMMDGVEPGRTEAGQEINAQIEKLRKVHKQELMELRSASERAELRNNIRLKRELSLQKQNLEEKIQRTKDEQIRLNETERERFVKRIEQMEAHQAQLEAQFAARAETAAQIMVEALRDAQRSAEEQREAHSDTLAQMEAQHLAGLQRDEQYAVQAQRVARELAESQRRAKHLASRRYRPRRAKREMNYISTWRTQWKCKDCKKAKTGKRGRWDCPVCGHRWENEVS